MQPSFPDNEGLGSDDPWATTLHPRSAEAAIWTPPPAVSATPSGGVAPSHERSMSSQGPILPTQMPGSAPHAAAGGMDPFAGAMGAMGMGLLGSQSTSALAGAGLQFGQRIFDQNRDRWSSWLSFARLQYYFNVNNAYVVNKIKILLFPFLNKKWEREHADEMDNAPQSGQRGGVGGGGAGGGQSAFKPPCKDVNAPDLYIPAMAFITYILLMGLARGSAGQFDPEVLGVTASSTLVLLLLELIVMKAGFYLMDMASPNVWDLVAYCAYKYVGMIIDIVVGLVFGRFFFWLVTFFFGVLSAVFMARTLRMAVLPSVVESATAYHQSGSSRRRSFLLLLGGLQLLLVLFLVRAAAPGAAAAAAQAAAAAARIPLTGTPLP